MHPRLWATALSPTPHALKSLSGNDGTTETTDLYTYEKVGNTTTRPARNWSMTPQATA
ncbi:hypothetical protein GCM10023088_48630 [Actinomadura verrucosospora]